MALDSNAQTTIYIYMLCVSFRTHREDVDDDESRVRRAHMDYIMVWSVVLPFLFCFFPSWFSVSFLLTHYSFPAHVFSHQVSISSKYAFIRKLKSSRASIDGILPFHTYGACKKQCYQQQWTANERQKRSAIFHFVHRMTRHDTVTQKSIGREWETSCEMRTNQQSETEKNAICVKLWRQWRDFFMFCCSCSYMKLSFVPNAIGINFSSKVIWFHFMHHICICFCCFLHHINKERKKAHKFRKKAVKI